MPTLPSLRPSQSPYSLSKHNDYIEGTNDNDEMELTTSGRTYQELVDETDESDLHDDDRRSLSFLAGRNSLSNWSTFGDVPRDIPIGKERVSSLETPQFKLDASNINGTRGSRSMKRGTSHSARLGRRSQENTLNLSHISSSSEEMGDWSPILSLERSLEKSKSPMRDQSKSPMTNRSPKKSKSPMRDRSKSPMRAKLPTRSPLGDISPNRSRGQSPKQSLIKSPIKFPVKEATSSPLKSPTNSSLKQALSPNATYSLKEAAGTKFGRH